MVGAPAPVNPAIDDTPWCEDASALASLFDLTHVPASQLRDLPAVASFSGMVSRFVKALATDGSSREEPLQTTHSPPQTASGLTSALWPQLHPTDLTVLTNAAAALSSSPTVTWYPEYGCALLAIGRPEPHILPATVRPAASSVRFPASTGPAVSLAVDRAAAAGGSGAGGGVGGGVSRAQAAMQSTGCRAAPQHVALHLVALDRWTFRTHGSSASVSPSGQGIQHTSSSPQHAVLYCGEVPAAELSALVFLISWLEVYRQQERQEGAKGFQRTPAFILCVVKDALGALRTQQAQGGSGSSREGTTPWSEPRGGFTDVGRHTGGDVERDTAWPLVRQVLQVV